MSVRPLYTGGSSTETGAAQFAFPSSGSLAYISGPHFPEPETQPLWIGREGTEELIDIKPASYLGGCLSPDQKKVALWTWYKAPSVWLYDLERGTLSRETVEGFNTHPTWRPDSSGLVFASNRKGPANVFFKPFQTGSEVEHLFPNPLTQIPASFSPDGKELAFVQLTRESGYDLWVGSMESRSTRPFVQSRFRIKHPAFSPDGRWLAYVNDETGRDQVYVEPYPGPGNRETVSPDYGHAPVWSRGGKELFYRSGRKMMAVEIREDEGTLLLGKPTLLFERQYVGIQPIRSYNVHRDGQRFLMFWNDPEQDRAREDRYFGNKLSIVLNWFEELERLVPTEN